MTESQALPQNQGYFYRAIVENHEPNRGHPQYEVWLNYALSTNQRGENLVGKLKSVTPSLKSKRLLDIGCGYGGTCLAAARQGAHAVGIDIDPGLLNFAALNSRDYPELEPEFFHLDVMEEDGLHALGQFDIITCDNVIEHVAVPERLIAHIRLLLGRRGFAYVTIPNAFSIGQVSADCHYGLFGISLLDPWDAADYVRQALGQPSYDVSYYYRYAVYRSIFDKYGLQVRLLNAIEADEADVNQLGDRADQLPTELGQVLQSKAVPEKLIEKLRNVLEVYLNDLETGLAYYYSLPAGSRKNALGKRLLRDYGEEVWYVVAAEDLQRSVGFSPRVFARKLLRRGKRWWMSLR